MFRQAIIVAVAVILSACSSIKAPQEEQTVIGRENDVRLEARLLAQGIGPNARVAITYDIQNLRSKPIAVADLNASSEYEVASRTITIHIGAEVPGNEFVPRLLLINSGGTESYTTGTRVSLSAAASAPNMPPPRYLRVKLHFLGDVTPFGMLIGIPERSIHDPELADTLFTEWVEHRESIESSAVPIDWNPSTGFEGISDPSRRRM
ncbi:MAG: hypothetical protein ACYC7A_17090 [Thermoanaerobaculia bacterium]